MDSNHDVIDENGPAADVLKPQEASRTTSDDEITIVDSDGPTITRSRPGYDKLVLFVFFFPINFIVIVIHHDYLRLGYYHHSEADLDN